MTLIIAPRRSLRAFIIGVIAASAALAGCHSAGVGTDGGSGDDLAVSGSGDLAGADLAPLVAKPCGNGIIDPGETCDDGNGAAGDGCSGTCQTELGWNCPVVGMACMRASYCGDGYVEAPETCDDGNSTPGDGCSGTCQTEPNYTCLGQPSVCTSSVVIGCGNGRIDPGETCDTGGNNGAAGSGCDATCNIVIGYGCTGQPSTCSMATALTYCGDGVPQSGEQCDDGNSTPGDGCSGTCQVEPNYSCSGQPSLCASTIVCNNGTIDPGETCDDKNTTSGDGCSSACQMENGWSCTGQPSVCTKGASTCGNGKIDPGETCDDKNTASGDGCSGTCQIENGYVCPTPGSPCGPAPKCGDGTVNYELGETCDDKNTASSDGCSGTCQIEPGFNCSGGTSASNPSVCVFSAVCGNGKIEYGEQCDDKNVKSSDGCSSTCQLEQGWTCTYAGSPCVAAKCGDGVVAGNEQCDTGGSVGTGGCSATCRLVAGYACVLDVNGMTSVCHATKCGDGTPEGFEQCDDGNLVPYDGCSPTCTKDATCSNGSCTAYCGDGIIEPGEGCDDGNRQNGDGCSAPASDGTGGCQIETGWTCATQAQPAPASLTIPILYRDIIHEKGTDGSNVPASTTPHPDFNNTGVTGSGTVTGLVATLLNSGKPIAAGASVLLQPDNVYTPHQTRAQAFCWWYSDANCKSDGTIDSSLGTTNPYAQKVYMTGAWNGSAYTGSPTILTLTTTDSPATASSVYAFQAPDVNTTTSSGTTASCAAGGTNVVPAACAAGYASACACAGSGAAKVCTRTCTNNTGFFPVDGLGWNDATLHAGLSQVDTAGDGKSHNFSFTSELHYIFTYDSSKSPTFTFAGDDDVWFFINGHLVVDLGGIHGASNTTYTLSATSKDTAGNSLGLTNGGWYSLDVFQAERHVTGSNYTLSLEGFVHNLSVCSPVCGDGVVEVGEACDLGAANAGTAATVGYGGCSADCKKAGGYCGDTSVDATGGEQCDLGVNLGVYGKGQCSPTCQSTPYCGDNVKQNQFDEACDDGTKNGTAGDVCTASCTLAQSCGNGKVEAGEACDDGGSNGSPGDPCSSTCTLLCGNGIVNAGEACDKGAGNNVGGYNGCNPDCTLALRCGDGIKTTPQEKCDFGAANNTGAYGGCNADCTLGPYCGDDTKNGTEQCDNGPANSATAYGAALCTTTCQSAPYCGDGIIESSHGEQCDHGAKNGTAGDTCNANCTTQAYCGDGIKNGTEQCDFGTSNNTGAYGGCNADCTLGPYCGDDIKNGTEQCDQGSANSQNAYGLGKCTTTCQTAPYCGDGIIESSFGEQCDGSGACDSNCKTTIL